MADPTIGFSDDQLMIALELNVTAPVASDNEPRPDGKREASEGQRRAQHSEPKGERSETLVEQRQGDMREPRDGPLRLSRLFHPAGHDVPDGEPAAPHQHEERKKEPVVEHGSLDKAAGLTPRTLPPPERPAGS